MDSLSPLIEQIHTDCHKLCFAAFGRYYENAGNIGIFCQSEAEYEQLLKVKDQITLSSENPNQKYFELESPIVITAKTDIPAATYTHLYIRKPDPSEYGKFRGDVDFYTDEQTYSTLLESVKLGEITNAEPYTQKGVGEMLEISQTGIASVAYLSTKVMTELIRVRH